MVDFISLETVDLGDEAAAIAEIQAANSGSFRLSELHFDRDLISEDYREFIRRRGEPWDDPDYLAREPETCFNLAVSHLTDNAISVIRRMAEVLGDHYPFRKEELVTGNLILKEEPTPIGIAYLWLRLYLLTKSPANITQFDDTAPRRSERESAKFEAIFAKVFEYIALFAVSGKYQGESWITAPLRSATDYLELLSLICDFVGHGTVKQLEQLAANELRTNDGRNDVIHLTLSEGNVAVDAQLYLVQATIQKDNLKQKVVTSVHTTFFNNFFLHRLNMPKHGVLVVPHIETELMQTECELNNCVYLPITRIIPNLGKVVLTGNDQAISIDFSATYSNLSAHIGLQTL